MSNPLEETIYQLLKAAYERGLLRPPPYASLLVNNRNYRFVRSYEVMQSQFGGEPQDEPDSILGIPVHVSDAIPRASFMFVSKQEATLRFPSELTQAFAEATRSIQSWTEAFFMRSAIPSRSYPWQRWTFESVRAWGERLDKRGLLDDPAIRWEYQKAVWRAFADTLLMLWRRS